VEVRVHELLTSALDGNEWLASRAGRFNPTEISQYPLHRGLCGPQSRSGPCGEDKNTLPFLKSNLGRPARRLFTKNTSYTSWHFEIYYYASKI